MKTRALLTVISASLFLVTSGARAQEGKMVAGFIRAVKVEGTAWQVLQGSGQQERLKEGDFLRQGNAIRTADNGRVILLFQNGSTINLQPRTTFSIDKFMLDPFDADQVDYRNISAEPSRSVTKISVNQGTITAKVAKLKRSSDYVIDTPLGTAGIRGTVVTVSVGPQSSTFVVTEGMIQVTKGGQTFWVQEGSQEQTEGNTRTGREGNEQEQTVVISNDENYQPPAGEIAQLTQQGQDFSQNASRFVPDKPFSGAPQDGGSGTPGTPGATDGTDDGGGDGGGGSGGGGSPPALPGGFGGGGGGGGGSSGGGSIYSQ